MKVKCIDNKDENSNIIEGLEVGKVYEVFTHDQYDYHYVYLDNLEKFPINCSDHEESKYFQVYQEKESAQKTIRDEFAMAVINAMGHQHDYRKIVEYTALAEAAYEMADAMLEVKNENEK